MYRAYGILYITRQATMRIRRKYHITILIIGLLFIYLSNEELLESEIEQYIAENILLRDIKIIDGDTLYTDGRKIRLYGIDAPEKAQECLSEEGKEYPCGRISRAYLWKLTKNQEIYCQTIKHDKYQRELATCYSKERNINQAMVRAGHAVAYVQYSKQYLQDELFAKKHRNGMWDGNFITPHKWRRLHR